MNNKFNSFQKKLEKATLNNHPKISKSPTINKFNHFYNQTINFFSCIITCTIIGHIIDLCLSKKFTYSIVMFFIGIITGIYNIIKKITTKH